MSENQQNDQNWVDWDSDLGRSFVYLECLWKEPGKRPTTPTDLQLTVNYPGLIGSPDVILVHEDDPSRS